MTETILNANDFRPWFIRGFYVLTTSDDSPPDLYIRASEMCKRKALWIIQYTEFHLVSLSWITASGSLETNSASSSGSAVTAIRSSPFPLEFSSGDVFKVLSPLGCVANVFDDIMQFPHWTSLPPDIPFNLLILKLGHIYFLFEDIGIGTKQEGFCSKVDHMTEATEAAMFNGVVNIQGFQYLSNAGVV